MSKRYFTRHGRGVFNCSVCGRSTRQTTQSSVDSECCAECWELAGLDNQVNDDGGGLAQVLRARDQLLADAVRKGGDAKRIMACNVYLWPQEGVR